MPKITPKLFKEFIENLTERDVENLKIALRLIEQAVVQIVTGHNDHDSRIVVLERQKKHCRVYNNAQIDNIPTGAAYTTLTFNTLQYDNDGMYDATATNKLTIRTAGYYDGLLMVAWEPNSTGGRDIKIRRTIALSGAVVDVARVKLPPVPAASGGTVMQCSFIGYKFEQNDFIEALVAQDSGGVLDLLHLSEVSPSLVISTQEQRYNPDEIPNRPE